MAIGHRGTKVRHKRLKRTRARPSCTTRVSGSCLPRFEGPKGTQHLCPQHVFSFEALERTHEWGCFEQPDRQAAVFLALLPWRRSPGFVDMASSFH